MKDTQTKERFMELRGQELALVKIAAEIEVSKTSLINSDRDLSEISTEKLFAMYAHFYRGALHALPELMFAMTMR